MALPRYLWLLLTMAMIPWGCGTQAEPWSGVPNVPASGTFFVGFSPETDALRAGGYTLTFILPALAGGNATTLSATLQAGLPAGISPPQFVKRGNAPSFTTIACDAATATNCVAVGLTVVPRGPIAFNSDPTFRYTLPQGMTIPPGSIALSYVTTNQGATWNLPSNLSEPGKISSVACTGSVSGAAGVCTAIGFDGLPGADIMSANSTGVYALVLTPQALTP